MGAVSSSLNNSAEWIRSQGTAFSANDRTRARQERDRRRRRRQRRRHAQTAGNLPRDVEARGEEYLSDDSDDYDSLDDNDHFEDDEDTLDRDGDDDDDSLLDGELADSAPGKGAYDNHPLYFGPAFHPVTEQSPAQLQLQRQIEQQLEQQQRQEYWQQQYRQQQQQQQQQQQLQQQQVQQHQQTQGLQSHPTSSGQQVSLNDLIIPSAVPGLSGHGGAQSPVTGTESQTGISSHLSISDSFQDQLYRNSNLYNLISGLNVNALLTEVQRAGTLDLSVLEQELDDVEGGWVDIDDDDDDANKNKSDDDTDIDYGQEGVVREMQPTKRSPTALACSVNLKKSTLRLVKNFTISNDPSIPSPTHLRPNYRLDFTFDSLTPCDVKLFWVVKEVEEDGELGFRLRRLHHLPQPTTYHFPAGMNQRFVSPILPLYTMSLPELTMQGLPSASMRLLQKRNQRQWQNYGEEEDGPENGGVHGDKSKSKKSKRSKFGPHSAYGAGGYYNMKFPDDDYKPIMEDQYFPLVILIEATREYQATAPARSLPTPVADAPGLYLVENQSIATFASFNISSEGGFEIKVMKQKVWINSTNYLIQEIYGFTDSVSSAPSRPENAAQASGTKTAKNKQRDDDSNAQQLNGAVQLDKKRLSRALSRLSRAESIASRVDELTMDRPMRSKSKRILNMDSEQNTSIQQRMMSADGRPASKASMVADLAITEPETALTRQTSITSTLKRKKSQESVLSGDGDGVKRDQEREVDESTEKEVEIEGEDDGAEADSPSLVLLDAPECVICLSDVKDTIVLPCRHFCICSECGDVLRRRSPQRCPICRQVFQALLHIASKPTRRPKFAMVSALAANPVQDLSSEPDDERTRYSIRL